MLGVIFIQTLNYSFFTISRCIFTQCKAGSGGALYLQSGTLYIHINCTRFENNNADSNGDDIGVYTSPCFSKAKGGGVDSSACSTSLGDRVYTSPCFSKAKGGGVDSSACSTSLGDRVGCGDGTHTSQSQNDCSKEVV
jgi:hypothetical protein